MVRKVGYSNVEPYGEPYAVKTGLGLTEAVAQDFRFAGTIYVGRVVAVRLCHGEIMLSVVQTWSDTLSERKLKWALETLEELPFSTFYQRLGR
ncbi:MAG TPA: hypothetical protein VFK05_06370 [Polyangiaceae bacterium]|nr:hypothetical protein [Polyangiaceae bacterium]